MTRAEVEAQVRGQLMAAMQDVKTLGLATARQQQLELRVTLVMSRVDALLADAARGAG
jgi:hypothetical protein